MQIRIIKLLPTWVRQALGDTSQVILKTVPRRGYQFDVKVRELYDRVPNETVRPQPQYRSNGPLEVEEVEGIKVVIEAGEHASTESPADNSGLMGAKGTVAAVTAKKGLRNKTDRVQLLRRVRLWFLAAPVAVMLVIAVSMIAIRWKSGPSAEPVPTLLAAQLTANPVDNGVYIAAISPDGKYLAYADLNGLHILAIDTGEVRNIRVPENFCPR